MLVPTLLLTPIKIRIFGPKTTKFGPKYAFLVILGQILPFLHILSNARPKNNVNKVLKWVLVTVQFQPEGRSNLSVTYIYFYGLSIVPPGR